LGISCLFSTKFLSFSAKSWSQEDGEDNDLVEKVPLALLGKIDRFWGLETHFPLFLPEIGSPPVSGTPKYSPYIVGYLFHYVYSYNYI
jgi:hypothetical protein